MDEIRRRDQQYFPTYHLSNDATEIAIKEYELAASTLAAEEKILTLSTSLLVGFIGVAAAFFEKFKDISIAIDQTFGRPVATFAVAVIFVLLTFSLTSYFADARRSAVNASRKIIILRRMLGLSYGSIELVLPSDKLEGANEPYHIRMFHGWASPKAIPIYCIGVTSTLIIWLTYPVLISNFPLSIKALLEGQGAAAIAAALWAIIVVTFYRVHLLDQYETVGRLIAVAVAKLLRQPIVRNFEYVIYRARLAVFEAERLKIPIRHFHPILIELEDRNFKHHQGVSARAIIAAIYRYIRWGKRSGGSTITQQLARSLFIRELHSTVRRKIVEILLALWLDRQFSKSEIADLYVCCVRYETGVIGIAEALKHFFPLQPFHDITNGKIFFLIERVSNVRSRLIVKKVANNLRHLMGKGLLSSQDVMELISILQDQMMHGRVLTKHAELAELLGRTRGDALD